MWRQQSILIFIYPSIHISTYLILLLACSTCLSAYVAWCSVYVVSARQTHCFAGIRTGKQISLTTLSHRYTYVCQSDWVGLQGWQARLALLEYSSQSTTIADTQNSAQHTYLQHCVNVKKLSALSTRRTIHICMCAAKTQCCNIILLCCRLFCLNFLFSIFCGSLSKVLNFEFWYFNPGEGFWRGSCGAYT